MEAHLVISQNASSTQLGVETFLFVEKPGSQRWGFLMVALFSVWEIVPTAVAQGAAVAETHPKGGPNDIEVAEAEGSPPGCSDHHSV